MSEDVLLGSVPLRLGRELRVILRQFKGRHYVNFRAFEKVDEDWVQTKDGVTFNADLLEEVRALLAKASR